MLIIQEICLQWYKKGRGADGERIRSQFPHAYPIAPQTVQGDILIQNLNFYAHGHPDEVCQQKLTSARRASRREGYSPARLHSPMQKKNAAEAAHGLRSE